VAITKRGQQKNGEKRAVQKKPTGWDQQIALQVLIFAPESS
jgi:hypothetical protein